MRFIFFLVRQSIDTFAVIVFVIFVDTVSITDVISSHSITEVSTTLLKYLLFSPIHVLGLQL